MYKQFTDRARKVLAIADQEAHNRNHEYVGTEHILFAIAKEGSGVGAHTLMQFGATSERLKSRFDDILKSVPDMVIMGKLPQTELAKKVVKAAMKNAIDLEDNHVGTEHLLLGLLEVRDTLAYKLCEEFGLDHGKAVAYIKKVIGKEDEDINCCTCDKFELCSFAMNLHHSDPNMVKALFGEIADSVVGEIFKYFAGRCQKYKSAKT